MSVGVYPLGEGVGWAGAGQDRKRQGLRYGAKVRGEGAVGKVVNDDGNVAGAAALGHRS